MLDYAKIINVFVRDAKFEYENGKNHFNIKKHIHIIVLEMVQQ